MIDLERFGACTLDQAGCLTCGDVAVPVRVLNLKGSSALCEDRLGNRAEIAIDFIAHRLRPDDVLLAHGGVAIAAVQP